MYQQKLESEKSSSRFDFLLVILFLLIAIFMRQIVDFCMALPAPWKGLSQMLFFCAFVGICLFIYKRRICSYRYTVVYAPPPEGEVDAYGNPMEWPWPVGTVLFERMVSNKGNLGEGVAPQELVALIKPGEPITAPNMPGIPEQKPTPLNTARLTRNAKKTAHTLVFLRKGKLGYIMFHPDETFCSHLEALLAAKRKAAAEENADA